MKTILISFFNSTNLGDLILSENMLKLLSEDSEVLCYTFPGFEKKVETISTILESTNSTAPKGGIKSRLIPIYRYVKTRYLRKFTELESDMANADRVIIGGGNMLMDLEFFPNYIAYFYKLTKIAEKYHKKVQVLCVGIGPLQNKWQERMLCSALNKCEYIAARDMVGKAFLEALKLKKEVQVCPDCAFMEQKQTPEQKQVIAINLCLAERYRDAYGELILKIKELFPQYKIILFSTEIKDYSDIENVCRYKNTAEVTEIVKIHNRLELYTLFARTKLVIATRMHSMILAFTQNVPVIGLSWSSKVDGLFELMQRPGDVFRQNRLSDSTEDILCLVSKKIENYDEECAHIADMVEKNKRIIQKTFLGGSSVEF